MAGARGRRRLNVDLSRRMGSDGLPEISRSEPGIASSWVVCISLVLQFRDRSWSLTDYIHIAKSPVGGRAMEILGDFVFFSYPGRYLLRRMYSAHSPSVTHEDLKKGKAPRRVPRKGTPLTSMHCTSAHPQNFFPHAYSMARYMSTCLFKLISAAIILLTLLLVTMITVEIVGYLSLLTSSSPPNQQLFPLSPFPWQQPIVSTRGGGIIMHREKPENSLDQQYGESGTYFLIHSSGDV